MPELKVTISLDERDHALLRDFVEIIRGCGLGLHKPEPVKANADPAELHPVENPFPAVEPAPAPAEAPAPAPEEKPVEAPKTAPEAPKAPEVKEYTVDDVRTRVMAISQRGDKWKAAVKKIVEKYATKVTLIKPEDRALVIADLEALEVQA